MIPIRALVDDTFGELISILTRFYPIEKHRQTLQLQLQSIERFLIDSSLLVDDILEIVNFNSNVRFTQFYSLDEYYRYPWIYRVLQVFRVILFVGWR